METAAVLLVTAAVALITWLFLLDKKRRDLDKLGGPKSLPLIGNVHQLSRHPGEFTRQFYKMLSCDYVDLPAWRVMIGAWPMVFVSSPTEVEALLSTSKHLDKSIDYGLMHQWLGTGLLTSTGEKWKTRRKLLTPTFHFRILHDFVEVFNKQAEILAKKFEVHADGKTVVNVFSDIALCTLDVICETAMGQCVNAQQNKDSEYVKAVNGAARCTFLRARTPWFWPKLLFDLLGPGKEYDQCLTTLHGFTEQVIKERQMHFSQLHQSDITMQELIDKQGGEGVFGKKQRLAFLDMLLCASADGEKLSFLDIREEVDTFMFEGHDTATMSTSWALHLIGSHPEVQQKVHEELDKIFGETDRDTTMEDLKEMKYLECCIKEALRIFPSVPLFGRSLTEDTIIAGVTVPKGTTTLILPWSLHMNPKLYPDPEKFDPDRFLPESCASRHPFAYLPFSAGSRNCIGQRFAILEEKVILSTILRKFHVQSTQTRENVSPLFEMMLRPANGITVILTKRGSI